MVEKVGRLVRNDVKDHEALLDRIDSLWGKVIALEAQLAEDNKRLNTLECGAEYVYNSSLQGIVHTPKVPNRNVEGVKVISQVQLLRVASHFMSGVIPNMLLNRVAKALEEIDIKVGPN